MFFIHSFTCSLTESVSHSINQPIKQSINQSIIQSINQSIHQPVQSIQASFQLTELIALNSFKSLNLIKQKISHVTHVVSLASQRLYLSIYLSIHPSIDALHNLMLSVLFAVHRFAIAIFLETSFPACGRYLVILWEGHNWGCIKVDGTTFWTLLFGAGHICHQPFVDWFGAARLTWTSMRALPSFGVFWWAFQLKQGEPAMAIATPKKTEK